MFLDAGKFSLEFRAGFVEGVDVLRHIRGMGYDPRKTVFHRRALSAALLVLALSACGSAPPTGPARAERGPVSIEGAPRFAEGAISTACTLSRRGNASAQTCGCIQAAADLTLSQEQQQRSTRFFNEPELLQAVKLSDTPANEKFWYDWARFAETAEALCT